MDRRAFFNLCGIIAVSAVIPQKELPFTLGKIYPSILDNKLWIAQYMNDPNSWFPQFSAAMRK